MPISSIQVKDYLPAAQNSPPPEVTAQRRELVRATKAINSSGVMGQNQLVFLVDPSTRRPVIRVEDRETHEVVLQLPPEYVLQLAQSLNAGSDHIPQPETDK